MLIVWLTALFDWHLGLIDSSRGQYLELCLAAEWQRPVWEHHHRWHRRSRQGLEMVRECKCITFHKKYYITHKVLHYTQSITLHTKYYITPKYYISHKVHYSQSITLHTKYYITHKVLHYTQSVTLIINYYIMGGIDDLVKVWKW